MRKQDAWPLVALGAFLATTTLWWALALWPLPGEAPTWLERARAVCFNTVGNGLPDRSGWILLVGQPLGILALLWVGWREQLVATGSHLLSLPRGRVYTGAVALLVLGGIGAAGARVATAGIPDPVLPSGETPATYPRLDTRFADHAGLVDQGGRPFSLEALEGRGALVTFAFAHCETICPLVVRAALAARDRLAGQIDLAVVAITLDPWRDTPSRLPAMAAQWSLRDTDFVLSGEVEAVERVLDGWNVARQRNQATGDVVHPALVYLVEPDGTVAYASTGAVDQLVELAGRMR